MKAMKLIYLLLLVTFVTSIETTGKPCSTNKHLPVINICTADTKLQNNHTNSVLIKADTMQNCTCELSVINQNKTVTVNMQKFGQENSSSPLAYNCGLTLTFDIGTDTIWETQCKVDHVVISKNITINNKITIRSVTVSGTLKPNEGYCIELKKAVSDKSGNQLELKCGIGSKITTNTTQSAEKTTKMTLTTIPTTTTTTTTVPTTTTTVPLPTTTVPTTTTTTVPKTTKTKTTTTTVPKTTAIDANELEILNFPSTDGSVTTNQAYEPTNQDDDDTTALALGASVGGFAAIIVAIAVICIYRRFRILSQCKKRTCSGANTIYDTLSLPSSPNVVETIGISNNYSSLNINDVQSTIDNRRLGETHIIPLYTISTAQGNNIMVKETARNTNKRRSEYANLVF